jgi:hypothetical protein
MCKARNERGRTGSRPIQHHPRNDWRESNHAITANVMPTSRSGLLTTGFGSNSLDKAVADSLEVADRALQAGDQLRQTALSSQSLRGVCTTA